MMDSEEEPGTGSHDGTFESLLRDPPSRDPDWLADAEDYLLHRESFLELWSLFYTTTRLEVIPEDLRLKYQAKFARCQRLVAKEREIEAEIRVYNLKPRSDCSVKGFIANREDAERCRLENNRRVGRRIQQVLKEKEQMAIKSVKADAEASEINRTG
jgi:hypothetical protein